MTDLTRDCDTCYWRSGGSACLGCWESDPDGLPHWSETGPATVPMPPVSPLDTPTIEARLLALEARVRSLEVGR